MNTQVQTATDNSPLSRKALRLPRVLAKTDLKRSTLYRLIKQGQFPAGHKLSERVVVWDDAEIDAWLAAKFAC